MIKRMLMMVALSLAIPIAACNQAGTGVDVSSVQNALRQACGFELVASTAAATIAALLGIPGIKTATDIAHAVCEQVNSTMLANRRGAVAGQNVTVIVQGVAVYGKYVR